MNTVAIYGLGLIGGSFGLALRKAGFKGEILGLCAPRYAERALELGAITKIARDFEEIARSAELIYLSHTVDGIIGALEILGPIASAKSLVTDSGSTKTRIVRHATQWVESAEFIGGHPIAGKEKRGIDAADPDLFRSRAYVLTSNSASRNAESFVFWLNKMGARVVYLTPEEHDKLLAYTSHLPQLVSTALAVTLAKQDENEVAEVFGPGLIDMTRLALSAPELWISIFETNKDSLKIARAAFAQTLEELGAALEERGDLEALLAEGARFAGRLRALNQPK